MNCQLDHRYDEKFSALPDRQQGSGRHICAGCAYEKGLELGKENIDDINISEVLNELSNSQAGIGRGCNSLLGKDKL